MSNLETQLNALDAMTGAGEILESLPVHYAEDCTFTEVRDGACRVSQAAQHAHLSSFFATLQRFNGATLHSSAISGDTSLSEWTFDMVAGDGTPIVWREVLVRRWREGKVIEEKFYNAT